MKAKVIPFERNIKRKEQRPLTPLMIVALLNASEKQTNKIPFGPNNVKGSITSLITRGLIEQKEVNRNGHNELLWQVTDEGFAILKSMGFDAPC